MRLTTSSVLALCLLVGLVSGAAAQQPPARGIVNVTGQIYRAQNNNHYKGFERWDTTREAHIAAVYATMKGTRPGASAGTR